MAGFLNGGQAVGEETFLAPEQHLTLRLPRRYSIVASSRPWGKNHTIPRGGVAAVVKDSVKFTVSEDISGPDLLVLELDEAFILCAYIVPENSDWSSWSSVDPKARLAEALEACASRNKPTLLLGDLNARTASLQPPLSPINRESPDRVVSTRGRWLLEVCDGLDLSILNGSIFDATLHENRWTSFQPKGSSVIDYGICSTNMLDNVSSFSTFRMEADSDHAAISTNLDFDARQECEIEGEEWWLTRNDILNSSEDCVRDEALEQTLVSVLESKLSDAEACRYLYGPVYVIHTPIMVYTHATSSKVRSTFACAVCWMGNRSDVRSFGDVPIADCYLVAIAMALMLSDHDKPLVVHTDSKPTIIKLVYLVGKLYLKGWPGEPPCAPLRMVCSLLKRRWATTEFRQVDRFGKDRDNHMIAKAVTLAERASREDITGLCTWPPDEAGTHTTWALPAHLEEIELDTLGHDKVSSTVPPPLPDSRSTGIRESYDLSPAMVSKSHRGRRRVREVWSHNLGEVAHLLDGAPRKFWRYVKSLDDPNSCRSARVPLDDLKEVFQRRMNPPAVLPSSFDSVKFLQDEEDARAAPEHTADSTEGESFSRPFVEEEVDAVKLLVGKRGSAAKGVDGIGYKDLMEVPSDKLARLFNMCIERTAAPGTWLTTILVGILKQHRAPDNPENYRVIALECCLLKMQTLLIARRFREWAASENMIPESQNGFRSGYRTSNCAFILRCTIDRALAKGETLIAAFVDLENAFPSTNLPTLWKKLKDNGASGPLIDWVRMLYERMRYTVMSSGAHGAVFTNLFRSIWGILAGDSFSTDLFTFYASDCNPPQSSLDNDIRLAGLLIPALFLADDLAMIEYYKAGAMEAKIRYMADNWCATNFYKLNATKTKMLLVGPLPAKLPTITVDDTVIEVVNEFCYVGVWFTSTNRNIFALHYEKMGARARSASHSIYLLASHFGEILPRLGIKLYMARVDPHLTYGCEVSLDVNPTLLQGLQRDQNNCLRRILGLGRRSMTAVLYTETGVMPIQYRRALLALKHVKYLLGLPQEMYASAAFRDSKDLLFSGMPGWLGDIKVALTNLPVPVCMTADLIASADGIDTLISMVKSSCASHLHKSIEDSTRTPLLHGRVAHGVQPTLAAVVKTRPYLVDVTVGDHRLALTKLLCAAHCLAVEEMRHKRRRNDRVPRDQRLCRFCRVEVEDEPHALFGCEMVPLPLKIRRELLMRRARLLIPEHDWDGSDPDRYEAVRAFLRYPVILQAFAAYVFHVLRTFADVEMYQAQELVDSEAPPELDM